MSDTVELEEPLECQIQLSWRDPSSVRYSSVGGSTGVLNTVELEGALECQIQLSWRNPSSVRYS